MGGASESSTPSSSPHNSLPVDTTLNYNSFTPASYAPAAQASPSAPSGPSQQEDQSPVLKEVSLDVQQKNDVWKKYLLNIFYLINVGALMLWVLVGAGFPWFFYISCGASFIECIIYGAKTKNGLFISTSIYVNITIINFLTYLATGGGYPWFVYPTISVALIPGIHYIVRYYRPDPRFWFFLHLEFYVVGNSVCFLAWLIDCLATPYPWFVYLKYVDWTSTALDWTSPLILLTIIYISLIFCSFPLTGWAILLLIHYNQAILHDSAKLILYLAVDIGVMITVAIRFALGVAGIIIPFFAIVVIGIYYLLRQKGLLCFKNKQQPVLPITNQPTISSPQPTYQNVPDYAPQAYSFQPQYYPLPQYIIQQGPYQPVQLQQPQQPNGLQQPVNYLQQQQPSQPQQSEPQPQPQSQQPQQPQNTFYPVLPAYSVIASTASAFINKLQDHLVPPKPETETTPLTSPTTTSTINYDSDNETRLNSNK